MGPETSVVVVVTGFAGLVGGVAVVARVAVRRPQAAMALLGVLTVLLLGGLLTSLPAFLKCFGEGGVAAGPLAVMGGAWALALGAAALAWARLGPLARTARRRGVPR
jgi:hypothetical protein